MRTCHSPKAPACCKRMRMCAATASAPRHCWRSRAAAPVAHCLAEPPPHSGRLSLISPQPCGQVGFGGPWDCAAGALVVREAGGVVTDVAGGPFSLMARRVLATNAHLSTAVAAVLREQPLGPREPRPPPGN